MQTFFSALLELIKEPLRPNGGVKTDSSILLIYPSEKELDFREYLIDTFAEQLKAQGVPFRLLDLTGFLFEGLDEKTIRNLEEDEFDDYRWMKQGLSTRAEAVSYTHLCTGTRWISSRAPQGSRCRRPEDALRPPVHAGVPP